MMTIRYPNGQAITYNVSGKHAVSETKPYQPMNELSEAPCLPLLSDAPTTESPAPPREETIQVALAGYCWQYSQPIGLPGSNVLGWESDMIGVTKAGIMHEYEIKLTLADFKADLKKDRHKHIELFRRGEKFYERKLPWGIHKVDVWPPANYFWYVVPKELASKITLPEYAGLLIVRQHGAIMKEVPAPRLHKGKITEKQLWQMMGSACGRFWSARRILVKHGIPFTENHEID